MAEPLGAGPFTYRTGEGLNIRVSVLARLTSPYAIAFLPNGDMLVTQRTGELKRIAKGDHRSAGGHRWSEVHRSRSDRRACMATWASPCIRASRRTASLYIAYAKPPQRRRNPAHRNAATGAPRSRCRARYADGSPA